jgi:hypothetical protein
VFAKNIFPMIAHKNGISACSDTVWVFGIQILVGFPKKVLDKTVSKHHFTP